MGVIQNSVNQTIGTIAAATAMGKHTLEQQKSNQLQAIKEASAMNKESTDIIDTAKDLMDKETGIENNIDILKNEIEEAETEKPGETKLFRNEKGKFISKDKYITAREVSLKNMDDELNAIATQKADLANRMEMYNKKMDVLKLDKMGLAPDLNKKINDSKTASAVEYIKGGNK